MRISLISTRGYHLFDNLPLGDAPHEPTAQNSKRCGCSTRCHAGGKTTPDLAGEPPIFVVESNPRFGFFRNTVNAGFVSGQIIIFQERRPKSWNEGDKTSIPTYPNHHFMVGEVNVPRQKKTVSCHIPSYPVSHYQRMVGFTPRNCGIAWNSME